MKKILLILSILLAAFGLFGCDASQPSEKSTLQIPTKEISRWDEIVQQGELRIGVPSLKDSFDNDLIDAFAKESGIPVTKKEIPQGSSPGDFLTENHVDILWGQIPATSDTSSAFRLSAPYLKSTVLYLSEKPDLELSRSIVVGVLKASAQELMVQGYYDTMYSYSTESELFHALNSGICDVILYDKALYENKPKKSNHLHIVKEVPYELAVAFEQNNVAVCTEVEKILAKIKADGTASEICCRWYPVDLITK